MNTYGTALLSSVAGLNPAAIRTIIRSNPRVWPPLLSASPTVTSDALMEGREQAKSPSTPGESA